MLREIITLEMIEKTLRDMPKIRIFAIRSFLFSRKLVLVFIVLKMLLMDIRLLTKEVINAINWDVAWQDMVIL